MDLNLIVKHEPDGQIRVISNIPTAVLVKIVYDTGIIDNPKSKRIMLENPEAETFIPMPTDTIWHTNLVYTK